MVGTERIGTRSKAYQIPTVIHSAQTATVPVLQPRRNLSFILPTDQHVAILDMTMKLIDYD